MTLGRLKSCCSLETAVLKPPQSRRFAIAEELRTARSVWTAARSPPLSTAAGRGTTEIECSCSVTLAGHSFY